MLGVTPQALRHCWKASAANSTAGLLNNWVRAHLWTGYRSIVMMWA